MSANNNAVGGKKFVDIRAIHSGSNKSSSCSFCVGDAIATHLIYCLNRDDSFSLNYACSDCAKGWHEITDKQNDRVV